MEVTMRDGPATDAGAEMLPKSANGEVIVTDGKGRRLTLKKPVLTAEFRMTAAVGAALAANQAYMGMVMPLIYLVAVDGQPVDIPQSPREVEALVALADHAGYAAIMRGIKEHFPENNPDMLWLAKNGAGTPG